MSSQRPAALLALAAPAVVLFALAAPARADLVLFAGEGNATITSNHYGFSGTYHDDYGKNGDEDVAHPGGGPVAFLYVVNADATVSTYFDAKAGPYDGADDTQVGVLNLTSGVLTSLALGGGNVSNIFAFDKDGIDASPYNSPGNAMDADGYGGPVTYFTGINKAQTFGTANFIGGLAADGGTTYFTLENAPVMGSVSPSNPVVTPPTVSAVPEPSALVLSAVGTALFALRRRGRRGGVKGVRSLLSPRRAPRAV